MKKLFSLLLCVVMVLSLVACGSKTDDTQTPDEPQDTAPELSGTMKVVATGDVYGPLFDAFTADTGVEVEWDDFATPLTNDAGVCGEVERVADALGIPTTANRALSLSGDDFAEYLLQTKGAYAYLGTANPKKPHTCISNHRGDFDIDEEPLPLGAALYAAYALSVLDPQFAK